MIETKPDWVAYCLDRFTSMIVSPNAEYSPLPCTAPYTRRIVIAFELLRSMTASEC